MPSPSNNPPEVLVPMSRELAQFLIDNCERNMEFGLKAMTLPEMSRKALEDLVALNEQFKQLRVATQQALKER